MTHGTSLLETLAADLVGQPTGDSLQDALRTAVLRGVACVAEMNTTGFDTNNLFDHVYLTGHMDTRTPFVVTSIGNTGAVYLVVCNARVDDVYRVAVQIYTSGKVNEHFYKMTLVRASDGSIRANPGW